MQQHIYCIKSACGTYLWSGKKNKNLIKTIYLRKIQICSLAQYVVYYKQTHVKNTFFLFFKITVYNYSE